MQVNGDGRMLTCQNEKDDPVHDEDGPENRHVEDLKPAAQKGDTNGAGGCVPEFEFGQAADEWAELLILLCRQATSTSIFHVHRAIEGLDGGVELGLEESQEQVEQIDA